MCSPDRATATKLRELCPHLDDRLPALRTSRIAEAALFEAEGVRYQVQVTVTSLATDERDGIAPGASGAARET